MIPALWFATMLTALDHVEAREQLRAVQATAHAIAMAFGGKESKLAVDRATRELRETAFPRVYPPTSSDSEAVSDG